MGKTTGKMPKCIGDKRHNWVTLHLDQDKYDLLLRYAYKWCSKCGATAEFCIEGDRTRICVDDDGNPDVQFPEIAECSRGPWCGWPEVTYGTRSGHSPECEYNEVYLKMERERRNANRVHWVEAVDE